MARAYLRYAPDDDRRPDPLAASVLNRAAQARIDEIRTWLKPRLPDQPDEAVTFALTTCMKLGAADGFRTSVFLRDMFKWPVDMDLCCLVRDTCNALAFALKIETREWVIRSGLRFPGSDGDAIEWYDHADRPNAGKIIGVDPSFAAAIVQPVEGLLKAGAPRRVFAEQVSANTTRGEHAIAYIGPPKTEAG